MAEAEGPDAAVVLVDFARTLADGQTVEDVFRALERYVADLLHVDGVGVLLLKNGDLTVADAIDRAGVIVERLEVELEQGPCTDAIRSGQHVFVPDLEQERERYPEFAPRAIEAGIRSIHALAMGSRSDLIGALNIIATEPRALTERELRIADMLAEVAVSYLLSTQAHERATKLASQLQHALDSRVVIEQAKGVLMGRHGLTSREAFEVLRRYARSNNRQLREVARLTCEGALDPS